jgi:putative ABC transport system permease protein
MRSLLTSLGVIIGVGSVIIMVALGEGSQREIERQITEMGTNLLYIVPYNWSGRGGRRVSFRMSSFTRKELQKIKDEASFATAISGRVDLHLDVVGPEGNAQISVLGVEPDYIKARNWKVKEGVFLEEEDLLERNRVAVLGNATAKNLFKDEENAVSAQIRLANIYFTVIGVLESKGGDSDDVILIPLDTAMARMGFSNGISTIYMSVVSKEYMEAAQKEAELILREARDIREGAGDDFTVINQKDMIDMASATSKTLTTLLAAIAGVSLLVGGIGIMNIMLVSVTERTREIGIRMAVGGRKSDILFQFLCESVILSLMGGVLGIGLAFLVCRIMSGFGILTAINPLIVAGSTIFAAFVGVVFGYYPALKAARLYPIDALRYE